MVHNDESLVPGNVVLDVDGTATGAGVFGDSTTVHAEVGSGELLGLDADAQHVVGGSGRHCGCWKV